MIITYTTTLISLGTISKKSNKEKKWLKLVQFGFKMPNKKISTSSTSTFNRIKQEGKTSKSAYKLSKPFVRVSNSQIAQFTTDRMVFKIELIAHETTKE